MENNENMQENEDMQYNEDMEREESMRSTGKNQGNNNKKKIITGVIIALVAIGLIGGFLWFQNNQNKEITALKDEIAKNTLTKENADYLQNRKYIDQTQLDKLTDIDQKAKDVKEKLEDLKNLKKDQLSILDPINKKLETKAGSLTQSLNYYLGLLPGLSSVINNAINANEIRNVANEKFDLQKIVNENVPFIKKKAGALSTISKVAYDKKALLKGDFSTIAGTYINSAGKEAIVYSNGSNNIIGNNECKGAKPKLTAEGYYAWGIGCPAGSGGGAAFFPIGVEVKIKKDDGTFLTVPTDITKSRVVFGQQVPGDAKYYYSRK